MELCSKIICMRAKFRFCVESLILPFPKLFEFMIVPAWSAGTPFDYLIYILLRTSFISWIFNQTQIQIQIT
jgi:hypothetical protein